MYKPVNIRGGNILIAKSVDSIKPLVVSKNY
ncbi:uncharacterized protein METZ01_LOCUS135214 [marine metagenome]|uniref:Uncharacterized protein n=1 Tax=marine metagenome TaxID=408172 RepID=A0A381YZI2_9ZZZZ